MRRDREETSELARLEIYAARTRLLLLMNDKYTVRPVAVEEFLGIAFKTLPPER